MPRSVGHYESLNVRSSTFSQGSFHHGAAPGSFIAVLSAFLSALLLASLRCWPKLQRWWKLGRVPKIDFSINLSVVHEHRGNACGFLLLHCVFVLLFFGSFSHQCVQTNHILSLNSLDTFLSTGISRQTSDISKVIQLQLLWNWYRTGKCFIQTFMVTVFIW